MSIGPSWSPARSRRSLVAADVRRRRRTGSPGLRLLTPAAAQHTTSLHQLPRCLERVNLRDRLVGPDPGNAREPHRQPAAVPIARLNAIECDFEDGVRLDIEVSPALANRCLQ